MKTPKFFLLSLFLLFGLWAHAADFFTKVTSESQLAEGDEIIIVNLNDAKTLGTVGNNNWKVAPVTIHDDGSISVGDEAAVITLEKNGKYWCFKTSQGYICTKKKSEVKSSNGLKASETATAETKVESIKFQSEYNDYAQIVFLSNGKSGNEANKCRYFYYQKSSQTNFFSCDDNETSVIKDGNPKLQIFIYKRTSGGTHLALSETHATGEQSNEELLEPYVGQTVASVTIDRTLVADGGWYTLCLPFALTASELRDQFKGATFEQFKSVSTEADGSVVLNFERVSATTAGTPYLVLPVGSDGEGTVVAPTFSNKRIETATAADIAHTDEGSGLTYRFTGNFDPTELAAGGTARFVGANGKELVRPSESGTLKGLRAYFQLPSSVAQAAMMHGGSASAIVPVCADGQTPSIVWSLDGRRITLDEARQRHVVVVVGGRKVIYK